MFDAVLLMPIAVVAVIWRTDGIAKYFAIIQVFLAATACWRNIRASRKLLDFSPQIARIYGLKGALAGIYVSLYFILFFTDIKLDTWLAISMGVSFVSWPLVWIWPANNAVNMRDEYNVRIAKMNDRFATMSDLDAEID
jgi:hypothetical protein